MLKTNSKQVKEKIRGYILEHFENYYNDNKNYINQELKNNVQKLTYIVEVIKKEYNHEIKRNHNYLTYNVFKDYCTGLPSVLKCEYYCNISAVNLVGDILEQTQEERNKYTESQAEELMTKLLYNELIKYYN
jgi:hypothetical protein